VKGKDHRFSLLLVRGFLAKRAIRVIRLSGKLYGREGKKNCRKKKKLILAPRSCSQDISGKEGKG